MKRIHVSGFNSCSYYQKAKSAIGGLSVLFPSEIAAEPHDYDGKESYQAWLQGFRESIGAPNHKSSPIVWSEEADGSLKLVGGCDDTLAWSKAFLTRTVGASVPATAQPELLSHNVNDAYDPGHGFEYDLVVIGGGSGGLAASKEAKKLGARVAVLDFVKPSVHGSKWGLGGTCVNVGCIPKKLMHTAALMGETAKEAVAYGWQGGDAVKHSWEQMREHVQDHIKGLNFGYRVQLREAGITYLNKLGRFVGPNTLECTDAKGKVQTITSARFLIAVGGRPTTLECPGAEHAITSDDLFSLEETPGKCCVVGAGYVALECAGFINGLHQGEVTVLVRSMLLRGFDREIVDKVQTYMLESGVKLHLGVLPQSITKLDSGKLKVEFSNGESDEFDTVLAAVGRYADTASLGLDTVGVQLNPKNGKIICKDEQTNVPNIYAVGDVVQDTPELTPVAIMAGRLLARRLFGQANNHMDYNSIATAVFTPLEIGTVGLTEEEAQASFGADNVDSYVSVFQPLEWSLTARPNGVMCIAKAIIRKDTLKVLGLHIAAPNAGEIIQGVAIGFRKGLVYQDLIDTVGIHPTTAEEFTILFTAKSSGQSTEKTGC